MQLTNEMSIKAFRIAIKQTCHQRARLGYRSTFVGNIKIKPIGLVIWLQRQQHIAVSNRFLSLIQLEICPHAGEQQWWIGGTQA